eukprot:21969_1
MIPPPTEDDLSDHPQMVDIPINDDPNDTTQFKVLTWNLWCMILAPRALSNPRRCANYVLSMAEKEEWSSFDGLILCNFQELWSWRTGLFPPFLLQFIGFAEYIPYLGVLISGLFQLISLLFGLLPIFKCLPIKYNPKSQMASKLRAYLPYTTYNCDIPFKTVLDNGLLILSNHKADHQGSFGYVNHACDDSLAYKGCIYAYFKKYHTLVLNTHLQSAGDGSKRMAQIEEIKEFIQQFRIDINKEVEAKKDDDEEYKANCDKLLKIIACGDWNVDMTNHTRICQCNKTSSKVEEVHIEMEMEKSVGSNDLESHPMDDNAHGESKEDITVFDQVICDCISRSASYADLPTILGLNFIKVSGDNPTCKEKQYGCLDHIFANFEFERTKEEYRGKEKKLSDHLMVKNEFTSSKSNMTPLDTNA